MASSCSSSIASKWQISSFAIDKTYHRDRVARLAMACPILSAFYQPWAATDIAFKLSLSLT